jgi:hypothetical protein
VRFGIDLFTLSDTIWVGDLGTEEKKSKNRILKNFRLLLDICFLPMTELSAKLFA